MSLLRRCYPHFARKSFKNSFTSTVRLTIYTNLPRKWSFLKEFVNAGFSFCVDEEYFENGAFRQRWRHHIHVISLPEFFSKTNPKWPLFVSASVRPFICLSVTQSVSPSVCPSIRVRQSNSQSKAFSQSVHQSVIQSVRPSVKVSQSNNQSKTFSQSVHQSVS